MGSTSFTRKPGEALIDVARREYPWSGKCIEARVIAPTVVAFVGEAPDGERFGAVGLFEGNFVKFMDESVGPYHSGKFPADMLAMLSPLSRLGYAAKWRERQAVS
jgi:hypothetical protein